MRNDNSSSAIEERKLALEEQKWHDERQLRHRELDAKLRDSTWSARVSPLMVTLAAGVLTLAGSVVAALIQGENTLQLEREKFDSSSALEERKQEHELILKMISVGDEEQARSNVRFLAETGLIKDKVLAEHLLAAKSPAVLPLQSGSMGLPPAPAELQKKISQQAIDLVVSNEISNRDTYDRLASHPTALGGLSGVTIGIGYDLGYVSANKFRSDWRPFLSPEELDRLSEAVGVRGPAAKTLALKLKDISVPYDNAAAQFVSVKLPEYASQLDASLPNVSDLSADSYGALVLLVAERGTGFDKPGDRFQEMRTIKQLMIDNHYEGIPSQIRQMKRLFQNTPGLIVRLEAVAKLFEEGLNAQP